MNVISYWFREAVCIGNNLMHLSLSCRVVLGVCFPALVLSRAGCAFMHVLCGSGLVWMHLLQHTARSVSLRCLHPARRERLQLRLHRGEEHKHNYTNNGEGCIRPIRKLHTGSSMAEKMNFLPHASNVLAIKPYFALFLLKQCLSLWQCDYLAVFNFKL